MSFAGVKLKKEPLDVDDELPVLTRYGDPREDPGHGDMVRMRTIDGHAQYFSLPPGECVSEGTIFVDTDGRVIEKAMIATESLREAMDQDENVDPEGGAVRCGLCREVFGANHVTEHFVTLHPEHLNGQTSVEVEHVPLEEWMREEQFYPYGPAEVHRNRNRDTVYVRSTRKLRKVSQVRVNPEEMTMQQLECALGRKMIEKIGRQVPVSLVDKKHARCEICKAIISLNKKFEIIHLVRHFEAWHPAGHRCAGTWFSKHDPSGSTKYLSLVDFAVINTDPLAEEGLQCIYCGMLMGRNVLAMHFHEVHPEELVIPECHLCLSELVVNARVMMKFGEPFDIIMPDEHHYAIGRFNSSLAVFKTEERMDAAIEKLLQKMRNGEHVDSVEPELGDHDEPQENVMNSRATLGRRNKPKRHFVMPQLRQAVPKNSRFVEEVQDCHWICRLCESSIIGAVTSAQAIRHYRQFHGDLVEELQEELCKARLERMSDGCMQLLGPALVFCSICNERYTLHRSFNMCRAVRHLKAKHAERMPEHNPNASAEYGEDEAMAEMEAAASAPAPPSQRAPDHTELVKMEEDDFPVRDLQGGASQEVTDENTLAMLRETYNLSFEKVHAMRGQNGETIYVLVDETHNASEVPTQPI